MANHASAEKRNRQRVRRTQRNRSVRSEVRTEIKKVRTALHGAKREEAQTALIEAVSSLDRAASKGVIHPKAASRSKARLARALHKLTTSAPTALED